MFAQQNQDSCLVTRDTLGISTRLRRAIRMLLDVKWEIEDPFLFVIEILGYLSIFKNNQASLSFEALNLACLLRCQRDMRPPVQMRLGHRAFYRVSTGDSDIPSSCEMKDEPAFKPLQGNPAFFGVKASWCPLHLRQQTQVPLTYLLLTKAPSCGACGKMAYHFSRSQGISSHLAMIWGTRRLPRGPLLKLVSSRLETGVSGNLWSCLKEVKPLVVYDVKRGMAMDPMQWNWASSSVDLVYTKLFHVLVLTSVSF